MNKKIKTDKYNIYPNLIVYKGNIFFTRLTQEEYEFISEVKGKKEKDVYIENPDKLKEDMENSTGMSIAEARAKMGYEEEIIDICDHTWCMSRVIQEFTLEFYCRKCLKIIYKNPQQD